MTFFPRLDDPMDRSGIIIASGLQMITAQKPNFEPFGSNEVFYCSQAKRISVVNTRLTPLGHAQPMGFINLELGEYNTPWYNSECVTEWVDFEVPLLKKRVVYFDFPKTLEFVDVEKQSSVGDTVYICVVINYRCIVPVSSYKITYPEDPPFKIPLISGNTLRRQKSLRPGSMISPKAPLGNLFDFNSNIMNREGVKVSPRPESPHYYQVGEVIPFSLDFGEAEYETSIKLDKDRINEINKGIMVELS